ncbi:hypothetical protein QQX98_006924 [Neonectria punicea]|uniref:Uncharacterized protein n=1 Tax=Neonectria punicea TaxID=979145 RepID=A0ABR1H025_9HYPO
MSCERRPRKAFYAHRFAAVSLSQNTIPETAFNRIRGVAWDSPKYTYAAKRVLELSAQKKRVLIYVNNALSAT